MTRVLERADWRESHPIPDWVGVYSCPHCRSLSDIGEDWGAEVFVMGDDWLVTCPVCQWQMHRIDTNPLRVSQERLDALIRRERKQQHEQWKARIRRWLGMG